MPTSARAPGLACQPFDHRQGIVLFLLGIFVEHQPFGFAIAAHVDPHRRIAMSGEIRMGQLIAHDRSVALAIGQIFEDRRNAVDERIARQPDARGKPGPVGHRNPLVGDLLNFPRKVL